MRTALLLLALVACGDDNDPLTDPELHELGTCTGWTGADAPPECEVPCESPEPDPGDALAGSCTAKHNLFGQPIDCGGSNPPVFEFMGVRGCCFHAVVTGTQTLDRAVFAVCQD